jgi:FAD/FMN-containing dehydrogenase
MTAPSSLSAAAAQTLRSALAGQAYLPGDPGYDEACRAWVLSVHEQPAVVVLPQSPEDVAAAVRFARGQGLRIAPQGTGHGSTPLESLTGAMLIRTLSLRNVDIDPETRTARAQAGAQWADVAGPAAEHGLAGLAGSSPGVGVTGYTLGGGLGWLARRHGLAANSVTAADLVTPDGRLVRTDRDHEPDLLWAIRGGGGSVGVITALEFTLYPVRELYAGDLFFSLERSSEVLHAWRQWTTAVPDEVTSFGHIVRLPDLPAVPDDLRGRSFVLVEAAYLGDAAAGADLLAPLRALGPERDTFAMTRPPDLGRLNLDPADPTPGQGDGALLAELPAEAIDALVAQVGPASDTPLVSIELRHLGGALARPVPGSAQPAVDAQYLMFCTGPTPTPEATELVQGRARALKDALAPWHADYDFYNFRESGGAASAVLSADAYRKLEQIKARYDPDQAIISIHPVWPARTSG